MPPLPPRFAVTPEEIDRVVADFYAAIRAHPSLGPVFAVHVTDWPAHEAKIAGFWRNAILYERSYDGNPLQVHREAGNVRPGMFSPRRRRRRAGRRSPTASAGACATGSWNLWRCRAGCPSCANPPPPAAPPPSG
jgi:hypothetical protein